MMHDCPRKGRLVTMRVEEPTNELMRLGLMVLLPPNGAVGLSKGCSRDKR